MFKCSSLRNFTVDFELSCWLYYPEISGMANSQKSQVILSISHHHGCRNDCCMDGGNGSCKGKKSGCASSGEDERFLRRRSNNRDNHGNSGSEEAGYAGSQSNAQSTSSKFVAAEDSTSSSSISGDIESEAVEQCEDHDPSESANHIALGAADVDVALSTQGRRESRDDGHVEILSSSTGGEERSVERVSKRQSSERMDKGAYKSAKLTQASKMQWPRWTVSHMLSLSTMEKVMNYYRVLKLANNLNDEELRCFLEEQLSKEKAGLSEITIVNRLRTKLYALATSGEPDSCSICMVDYKEQDKVASLYYCSHVYHEDCITQWLPKNNLCPMCRALAIIPEDYPSWNGDACAKGFPNKGVTDFGDLEHEGFVFLPAAT